jgi:hypothetical protein
MANVFAFLTPAPANARTRGHPESLSDIIDELTFNLNKDNADEGVRLGVLLNAVGRRSYGPLLLVVGLFSISPATILPGMTWLSALVVLLIAGQMAVGLKRPWLPKQLTDIKLPRRPLFNFLEKARPIADRMDGVWLRARLGFLSAPPFVNLVALFVMAAALITIPLGLIPFAPLAPGLGGGAFRARHDRARRLLAAARHGLLRRRFLARRAADFLAPPRRRIPAENRDFTASSSYIEGCFPNRFHAHDGPAKRAGVRR